MAVSSIRRCKSCKAPIRWVRSKKNHKPVPLNPCELLIVDAEGHAHRGYIPHWATCPQADEHRRRAAMGPSFLTAQQQRELDTSASSGADLNTK